MTLEEQGLQSAPVLFLCGLAGRELSAELLLKGELALQSHPNDGRFGHAVTPGYMGEAGILGVGETDPDFAGVGRVIGSHLRLSSPGTTAGQYGTRGTP